MRADFSGIALIERQRYMNKEEAFTFFKKHLSALADIPEELIRDFFDICRMRTVKKGEFYISAGEVPEYAGFNMNGIFRLYYCDENGNDWTKGFSTQGKFVISYSAMVQERPSFFSMEAITDTDILEFKFSEWMKMIEAEIRWYPVIFKLLQNIYIMKETRAIV
jgi:CRP-like cAMP-binding protein